MRLKACRPGGRTTNECLKYHMSLIRNSQSVCGMRSLLLLFLLSGSAGSWGVEWGGVGGWKIEGAPADADRR